MPPSLLPVIVFLMSLAVYAATCNPTVWWLDSGIYLSAVKQLGIAYPPGYPLYLLLAHGFSWLPLPTTFAYKVNLFSGICAALAAGTVTLIARQLQFSKWAQVAAGLSLAFAYSLWAQAINAEVYALQALLTALVVWGALSANLWLMGIAMGLGFANHPMSAALLPLVVAVWWKGGRPWGPLAAGALLAVVPYVYLPLRSHSGPLLHGNWGLADGAQMILPFLIGATWTTDHSNFSLLGGAFWKNLWSWAQMSQLQWGWLGLIASLVGAWHMKQNRVLIYVFASSGLLASVYLTGEMPSWLIPSHLVLAVAIGAAVHHLPARARWVGLLVPVAALGLHGRVLDRHASYFAEDYGRTLLHGLPKDAILLISGDNPLSTVMYLQSVEDLRPDVTVIHVDAYREPWYQKHLNRLGLTTGEQPPLEEWGKTRPLFGLVPSHIPLPKGWYMSPAGATFRITRNPPEQPTPAFWRFPTRQDPLTMPIDPELGGKHIDCRREVWQLHARSWNLLAGWYDFLKQPEQRDWANGRLKPFSEALGQH